jgi:hypothetical protein
MDLKINKKDNDINAVQFLRSLGWAQIYDRRRDKISYVKRLGSDFYPRLHMYFSERESQYVFSMHLDQKKASYEGHHAHSGEYDNELVEKELAIIEKKLNDIKRKEYNTDKSKEKDFLLKSQKEQIGFGDLNNDLEGTRHFKKRKKNWFKKIFKI